MRTKGGSMGIWLELGIFGLVFVFAFWQMHDVRKAQEKTRQQRALEQANHVNGGVPTADDAPRAHQNVNPATRQDSV